MSYVGLHSQIRRNNFSSGLLLVLFPVVLMGLSFIFFYLLAQFSGSPYNEPYQDPYPQPVAETALQNFVSAAPLILLATGLWFLIAYFANTAIIRAATGARTLERTENKRVYNLVENLCIAQGIPMPKVNVIEDDSLNAFASGINRSTYTVSLSRGIINRLNDEELEGVIAHELTHIQHRDVRLLIISVVFVGIFAFLAQSALHSLRFAPLARGNRRENQGGALLIMLLVMVLAFIGYLIATLMRFAISRKREYMADAGASQMTRNPHALASALRKISGDPTIEAVTRSDVAQMFIENPAAKGRASFSSLFATHPPIAERIRILEQF